MVEKSVVKIVVEGPTAALKEKWEALYFFLGNQFDAVDFEYHSMSGANGTITFFCYES